MKKYLLILLICLFPSICFGAISAEMVWEIRTTGSQGYSGGFNTTGTGKDYSQADTCLASWVTGSTGGCNQTGSSNVTNNLATSGTWTTLGSTSANFTASMVRNTIHITGTGTSNFTPGWYEITGFNSTSSVTLDRACATGNSTAGTGYLGGAFKIGGTLDNDFFQLAAKPAGNTVYIQSGAYTVGETIDASTADGTVTVPVSIIGYVTNRATTPTGTDRPTLAFGNSYILYLGDYTIVKNIIFTKTGGSAALITPGTSDEFFNIKVSNTTATANQYGITVNTNLIIDKSEITVTNGYGLYTSTWSGGMVKDSYIYNCVDGIHVTAFSNGAILNNIFDTNSSNAIYLSGTSTISLISQNTFYNGSKTGNGISGAIGNRLIITNNIFEGFSVPLTFTSAQPMNYYDYNAYFDNTSASNSNVTEGSHSVDLIATAFVSGTPHASTDFRVGAGVKALATPGSWVPMGLSADCVGYPDIGAVQRIEPTGGGTGGAYSF